MLPLLCIFPLYSPPGKRARTFVRTCCQTAARWPPNAPPLPHLAKHDGGSGLIITPQFGDERPGEQRGSLK